MFAILCHDLGKATATTTEADGRIRAIDHEYQGIAPTKTLLYRLSDEHDFIEQYLTPCRTSPQTLTVLSRQSQKTKPYGS
ncbi:MAG: hypothetical protein Q9M36_14490 [Sulfurovum sp.]|nr:hypothetical protein [Sulfurovum sp.]